MADHLAPAHKMRSDAEGNRAACWWIKRRRNKSKGRTNMARRKRTSAAEVLMDLIAMLPWWVGVALKSGATCGGLCAGSRGQRGWQGVAKKWQLSFFGPTVVSRQESKRRSFVHCCQAQTIVRRAHSSLPREWAIAGRGCERIKGNRRSAPTQRQQNRCASCSTRTLIPLEDSALPLQSNLANFVRLANAHGHSLVTTTRHLKRTLPRTGMKCAGDRRSSD